MTQLTKELLTLTAAFPARVLLASKMTDDGHRHIWIHTVLHKLPNFTIPKTTFLIEETGKEPRMLEDLDSALEIYNE